MDETKSNLRQTQSNHNTIYIHGLRTKDDFYLCVMQNLTVSVYIVMGTLRHVSQLSHKKFMQSGFAPVKFWNTFFGSFWSWRLTNRTRNPPLFWSHSLSCHTGDPVLSMSKGAQDSVSSSAMLPPPPTTAGLRCVCEAVVEQPGSVVPAARHH